MNAYYSPKYQRRFVPTVPEFPPFFHTFHVPCITYLQMRDRRRDGGRGFEIGYLNEGHGVLKDTWDVSVSRVYDTGTWTGIKSLTETGVFLSSFHHCVESGSINRTST